MVGISEIINKRGIHRNGSFLLHLHSNVRLESGNGNVLEGLLLGLRYSSRFFYRGDIMPWTREERNAYQRKHYQANKEKHRIKNRKYYTAHKKESKEYRKINKERIRTRMKKYNTVNHEKILDNNRAYREKNREKYNTAAREYRREQYINDPKYRLNHRIRRTIGQSLRMGRPGRAWEPILNYTLDDLVKHLKKTLPPGYTWEEDFINGNGVLEMDHIIPICAFNFTKPEDEDFKRCWALKNLQVITKEKNVKKGATLATHFQPGLAFG